MEIVQQGRDNDDSTHDKSPGGLKAFVGALEQMGLFQRDGRVKEVEIYFIEGATYSFPWNRDRTALFPDTHEIRDQVMRGLEEDLREGEESRVRIEWKDRSHYLKEGWTDEIDPQELRRWRREEYGEGMGYDSDEEEEEEEDAVESIEDEQEMTVEMGVEVEITSEEPKTSVASTGVDRGVITEEPMAMDSDMTRTNGSHLGIASTECAVVDGNSGCDTAGIADGVKGKDMLIDSTAVTTSDDSPKFGYAEDEATEEVKTADSPGSATAIATLGHSNGPEVPTEKHGPCINGKEVSENLVNMPLAIDCNASAETLRAGALDERGLGVSTASAKKDDAAGMTRTDLVG